MNEADFTQILERTERNLWHLFVKMSDEWIAQAKAGTTGWLYKQICFVHKEIKKNLGKNDS